MDFYTELLNKYKDSDAILLEDVYKTFNNINKNCLRQKLNRLVIDKKLYRLSRGVYSFVNSLYVNSDSIFTKKYIKDNKNIKGYYSGLTLLNNLKISYQKPNIKEITTNNESTRNRKVKVNGFTLELKRARVKINNNNYKCLEFLDLLNVIEKYKDVTTEKAKKIIKDNYKDQIDINIINKYIKYYPSRVYKTFMEYNLYKVFNN